MSADNWAYCKRCTEIELEKFAEREAAIAASYGVVTVEEFDATRRMLDQDKQRFERRQLTFREDYEIYGATDGLIIVDYSGSCTKCGLNVSFKTEHPVTY